MGVLLEGNFFVICIVYDYINVCYGLFNGMVNFDFFYFVIMYIKCFISNGGLLFLLKIGMVIVYIYLMLLFNDLWVLRIYLYLLRMYFFKFYGDCL